MTALLTIKDLKVYYPIKTGILNRTTDHIKAVDGVDLVRSEEHTSELQSQR